MVCRAREVVTETAAAGKAVCSIKSHNFRIEVLGGSNAGNVGAPVWEGGEECRRIFAIVGEAIVSGPDTVVATGSKERCALCSQLSEELADLLSVCFGDRLLVITVGRADNLWKGIDIQDCVEELQVRFIGVGSWILCQ